MAANDNFPEAKTFRQCLVAKGFPVELSTEALQRYFLHMDSGGDGQVDLRRYENNSVLLIFGSEKIADQVFAKKHFLEEYECNLHVERYNPVDFFENPSPNSDIQQQPQLPAPENLPRLSCDTSSSDENDDSASHATKSCDNSAQHGLSHGGALTAQRARGTESQTKSIIRSAVEFTGDQNFVAGPSGVSSAGGQQLAVGLSGVSVTNDPQIEAGPSGVSGPVGQQFPVGPSGFSSAGGQQFPVGPSVVSGPGGQQFAVGPSGVSSAGGQQFAAGPSDVSVTNNQQFAVGPSGVSGPVGQQFAVGPSGVNGPGGRQFSVGPFGVSSAGAQQFPVGPSGVSGPGGQQFAVGPSSVSGPGGQQFAANLSTVGASGGSPMLVIPHATSDVGNQTGAVAYPIMPLLEQQSLKRTEFSASSASNQQVAGAADPNVETEGVIASGEDLGSTLYMPINDTELSPSQLENYFLRKEHGGDGAVKVMQLKDYSGAVGLQFSCTPVADRVFKIKHVIADTEITLYRSEQELRANFRTNSVEGRVVHISLSENLTADDLKAYFMQPKHRGKGLVRVEVMEEKRRIAQLTFSSVKATDDVLNLKHVVKGQQLHLRRPFTIPEEKNCLCLSKLPKGFRLTDIERHFILKRNGGNGGEFEIFITDDYPDEAELLFDNPDVVDQILAHSPHYLYDQKIEVQRPKREVFTVLRAELNPRKLRLSETEVLLELRRQFGVSVEKQRSRVFVQGSLEQISRVDRFFGSSIKSSAMANSDEKEQEETDSDTDTEEEKLLGLDPSVVGLMSGAWGTSYGLTGIPKFKEKSFLREEWKEGEEFCAMYFSSSCAPGTVEQFRKFYRGIIKQTTVFKLQVGGICLQHLREACDKVFKNQTMVVYRLVGENLVLRGKQEKLDKALQILDPMLRKSCSCCKSADGNAAATSGSSETLSPEDNKKVNVSAKSQNADDHLSDIRPSTVTLNPGSAPKDRTLPTNEESAAAATDTSDQHFQLKGVSVLCHTADITQLDVGAVVNVINSRADLSGGLAKALSDAAGADLSTSCQDFIRKHKILREGEAFSTDGFKLSCNRVIHVNAGRMNSENINVTLGNVIRASLDEAQVHHLTSVAVPAIGSGTAKVPVKKVAQSLVNAIADYLKTKSQSNPLVKIHLVDRSQTTVKALATAMQSVNGETSQAYTGAASVDDKSATKIKDKPSKNEKKFRCLKPEVVGYMFKVLGPAMGLGVGAEVREIWTAGDADSAVIVPKAHVEEFDKVYTHYLRSVMFSSIDIESACINAACRVAERLSKSSKDLCIRVVDDELILCGTQAAIDRDLGTVEYQLTNEFCSSKCVCNKKEQLVPRASKVSDTTVKKSKKHSDRKAEEPSRAPNRRDEPNFGNKSSVKAQDDGAHSTPKSPDRSKAALTSGGKSAEGLMAVSTVQPTNHMKLEMTNNKFEVIKGLEIFAFKSDMSKMSVDAVVNTIDSRFSLGGGLARALSSAAGPEMEKKCKELIRTNGSIAAEVAVPTKGYKLPCTYVIHVNIAGTTKSIEAALSNAFQFVDSYNLESLAIPAIGAGVLGVPIAASAAAVLRAIKKYCEVRGTRASLKHLHLVDFSATNVEGFRTALLQWKNTGLPPAHVHPQGSSFSSSKASGSGKTFSRSAYSYSRF